MKVNSRVFTERTDLLGDIKILNCPAQFRSVAERLIMMVTTPGYACSNYNTVSELDKVLTLAFWKEYDGLDTKNFEVWFITSATLPDMITRARRWLVEHNYLFLKPDIQENAMEASSKWKQSIKS